MFMALAPADSSCSHAGTLGCGFVRLTTAMTSGASVNRFFSTSVSAAVACGFFCANTFAMISPARRRASPSNTMNRHGVSLPWSGTRAPMVNMVSSSAGEGPGAVISRGLTERRTFRRSMASGTIVSLVAGVTDLADTGENLRPYRPIRIERSGRSFRPLHVGWCCLFGQRGNRLIRRHHLLCLAAEPAHGDRMGFGFLFADDEQRRDFRQRMLADLVVDLLVAKIDLDSQARVPCGGSNHLGIFIGLGGNRGDHDLRRRQPEREVAGIVLDQDADEAFHRAADRPVHHHRDLLRAVVVDVECAE